MYEVVKLKKCNWTFNSFGAQNGRNNEMVVRCSSFMKCVS